MTEDTFSKILKSYMDSHGINQKWLAEAAHTTEATISRYVNGIHQPNMNLVIDIAKALDVSVDYLFGLTAMPYASEDKTAELRLLVRCYNKASERDKKLLWGILEDYMNSNEKGFISHLSADKNERAKGNVG